MSINSVPIEILNNIALHAAADPSALSSLGMTSSQMDAVLKINKKIEALLHYSQERTALRGPLVESALKLIYDLEQEKALMINDQAFRQQPLDESKLQEIDTQLAIFHERLAVAKAEEGIPPFESDSSLSAEVKDYLRILHAAKIVDLDNHIQRISDEIKNIIKG